VAAVVQVGCWVPANKLQVHPLEKHKNHMEWTKLPWIAGEMECTLCYMDGFVPVLVTPERPELCFASTHTTPFLECEQSARPVDPS